MNEHNYTIYIHKNKQNKKVYIGQTKQNPEKRWGYQGEGYKTSIRFYNAIKKYGWDNFEHIILFQNLTLKEANEKEQELIASYHSTDERYGYNIKEGGKNAPMPEEIKKKIGKANKISLQGNHWNEHQRQVMSEMFSGEGNPFYGQHHTEESKKKISQNRSGEKYSGENHPFYGKHHTEESKVKISNNRQGKGGKKVRCINTGQIFNTMMDGARWCGLKTGSSIGQVCNKTGKQTTAGLHPETGEKLYWEFVNE